MGALHPLQLCLSGLQNGRWAGSCIGRHRAAVFLSSSKQNTIVRMGARAGPQVQMP